MPTALTILLDSPQSRISKDVLSTLASGKDWDPKSWGASYGTWVEPVANRVMLEPGPMNAQWITSNTGRFAKWAVGDFTLGTGSGTWKACTDDGSGAFMWYTGANDTTVSYTNFNVGLNQGICFEFWTATAVSSRYPILNLGWSATHDASSGVCLELFGNGDIDVYKNGACVGQGKIGGDLFGYYDAAQGTFGAAPKDLLRLIMIPCSDRELLVVCPTHGGGFSHVFLDLEEGVAGQTILDNAPFWFQVVPPYSPPVKVRVAPIQFAASGTIASNPTGWRLAPPYSSPDVAYVYQDLTSVANGLTCSLVAATSGFPNLFSVPHPVQLQVSLSGGPSQTPFVYGALAMFDTQTAVTSTPVGHAAGLDVTSYMVSATIESEDAVGGHRATIRLRNPRAIAALGSPNLDKMCDRAFALSDASGVLGSFIAESPITEDDFGMSNDDYDAALEVELAGRDGWKLAEDYEFGDCLPFDTLTLAEAFTQTCRNIGFGIYISAAASSLKINASGVSADGEWNMMADVGDRGSEVLQKLHQAFVPNWWLDLTFSGTQWVLNVLAPTDMPSTSAITLYRSIKDAIAIGGYSAASAPYFVYRHFKKHYLEPEASQAWTLGEDFRTGRPLIVGQTDDAAADPTTPVASRPLNWVGYLKKVAFGTPALTIMTDLQNANDLFFSRVTAPRLLGEFECEYLDGINRGQIVTLSKALDYYPETNTGTDLSVRLKTFSGGFDMVAGSGAQWRPARYVGENSSVACPLGVGGTSIRKIKANWALRALSKARMDLRTSITGRRPYINVQAS